MTSANETNAKLRWTHNLALDPTTTGIAYNIYRLNSLYDPDLTGTGTQPMGFDQYAAFYTHYEVKAVKIKVTFSGTQQGGGAGALVGMKVQRGSGPASTQSELLQSFDCQYRAMPTCVPERTITKFINIRKWLGIKPGEDARVLSAETTDNPSEDVYLQVFNTNMDPSATVNPQNVHTIVEFTYYVNFRERRSLAES